MPGTIILGVRFGSFTSISDRFLLFSYIHPTVYFPIYSVLLYSLKKPLCRMLLLLIVCSPLIIVIISFLTFTKKIFLFVKQAIIFCYYFEKFSLPTPFVCFCPFWSLYLSVSTYLYLLRIYISYPPRLPTACM